MGLLFITYFIGNADLIVLLSMIAAVIGMIPQDLFFLPAQFLLLQLLGLARKMF